LPAPIVPGKEESALMSLLEVSHLRKCYGNLVAVDDLSFRVEAGEIFGLLGPNGAGKTTAMMILAGLRASDGGQVVIDSRSFSAAALELKSLIGVVPQELAIYPDLSAEENLSFFGRLYGVFGRPLEERMERVLDIVGLSDNRQQLVRTFSGGMKRRLNFAVGILHDPKLVILDEPTVGVDPQSRTHLLDCIRNLSREKVAVIYCSHYMEEIEALCHRVAIMDQGRLLACGTLDELLDRNRADLLLRVRGWSAAMASRVDGVADVEPLGDDQALLHLRRNRRDDADGMAAKLAEALERLRQAGVQLQKIETKEHNLERLFLELTGRRLRD